MRHRDECMPLTCFFRECSLLATIFAWRSLTTEETIIFSIVFCVAVCGLIRTYLYYLHESTNHVDLPELV